jgi:hypothetical protein
MTDPIFFSAKIRMETWWRLQSIEKDRGSASESVSVSEREQISSPLMGEGRGGGEGEIFQFARENRPA